MTEPRLLDSWQIARAFGLPLDALPLVDHRYNPNPFPRLRLFRWLPR